MNHRTQNQLKRISLRDKPCTMCGKEIAVSHGQKAYYRGIQVHIELCSFCSRNIIKRYLDRLLEGSEIKLAIDELSMFGQK